MRLFGIETWLDRGELFSIFSGTIARLWAIEVRSVHGERRLGFRPPLVGLVGQPYDLLRRSATGMMLCEKRNVCPVCFNEREPNKEELVQNAEEHGPRGADQRDSGLRIGALHAREPIGYLAGNIPTGQAPHAGP